MKSKFLSMLAIAAMLPSTCPCIASTSSSTTSDMVAAAANPGEATANTSAFPKQILKSGINLNSTGVSANSMQLATDIQLTPVLDRIQALRQKIDTLTPSAERSDARLELLEAKEQAMQIIIRTNLEIDFVLAEMSAEQNVYNEILSTFTSDRDKLLARVNAASFISNGALWAVCEGLTIPTHTKGVYAVSSGITGILAGIIPSFASLYTLKAVNGKKKTSEVEPNMLAKLFNYPTSPEIEYPASTWSYLNEVPAATPSAKTRKDQMVDRWIADSNIPGFTNRNSKTQLDVITGSVAQKKGLSIATLNTRQVMLEQLSAEVMKMKRLLLELAMVVQGDKQLVATQLRPVPTSKNLSTPRSIASQTDYSSNAAANLTMQALGNMGVP